MLMSTESPYHFAHLLQVLNEKKDTKQCLSNTPRTVMVNKENEYQEYKGHTKWLSLQGSYLKKNLFGMTLLHAHAQYVYIVNANYQKASVKALVQVDFPVYAQAKSLFKHIKSKQEKMANFTKLLFCQKTFFCIKRLHANVQWDYIV